MAGRGEFAKTILRCTKLHGKKRKNLPRSVELPRRASLKDAIVIVHEYKAKRNRGRETLPSLSSLCVV